MSLATSNRDGGRTSEAGHLRAIQKGIVGEVLTGLAVSQRGAGANMSVDVAIGDAVIPRSDGTYGHPAWADAIYNQVISAADVSNPRRDIIVMYIDYSQAPSTGVSNNTNGVVKIKVVNGTPAGSPADPSDAAIQTSVGASNPFIKLARVRVAAAASSITNSVIDDLRIMAQARINGGWTSAKPAALTFTSYSSTTKIGVIATDTDLRSQAQVGHRIAFWQLTGGWKYGIIHAITASAITVFFGTDYTLVNEALYLGKTSAVKGPMGFPTNPLKWTLESVNVTDSTQGSAVPSTWYNLGGHSLQLGVGDWDVYGSVSAGVDRGGAGRTDSMSGISTSASSVSHSKLIKGNAGGNGGVFLAAPVIVNDVIELPSGGTLYAITRSTTAGISTLYNFGQLSVISGDRIIRARSAHL